MNRRKFLTFAGALGFAAALDRQSLTAQEQNDAPVPLRRTPPDRQFSYARLLKQAKSLSQTPHNAPQLSLPSELANLDRESYESIQYRNDATIWRDEVLNFRLKLLHTGFQYRTPVEIEIVENGTGVPVAYSPSLFDFNAPLKRPAANSRSGFSGLSADTLIHNTDDYSAFLAFQGATFFRALASGQVFGLSARALSINTAQSRGEEFPFFRKIWVEKPQAGERVLTIYALMDSPGITGAYRFRAAPGESTVIDVDCTLFPRKRLPHVGIAPISSMYFYGAADPTGETGYRPNVHSSDGLQIWNAAGEWIWRPITNPEQLQYSVFVDRTPRGFGLLQRKRSFGAYEDLDARFDIQPTLWVEPVGNWREGAVDLIEVPSQSEIFNNIIVFWRPRYPLERNNSYSFSYRLHWAEDIPLRANKAGVGQTLIGRETNGENATFIIDFDSSHSCSSCNLNAYDAELRASSGEIISRKVQYNPATGGQRVMFGYRPGEQRETDLICQLKYDGQVVSETWVYRWSG
ncbi:MAG: glucan biosynthesis protein [Hyphomicrobiales bacterium]|nr:glucan biosynthesis protein [Hyphomicrobiales bacterium]